MATDNEDPSEPGELAADVPEPVEETDASGEELRRISEEISALYPPPRLGTELVLLEVNPHRAHAYWNVDVEDFRDAQKRGGLQQAPMVLRVYDVTGVESPDQAHASFDVEVQGLQGHWYIDLWKDGRTHVADLGFRKADGGIVTLAHSNPVSTPPAAESGKYSTLALDTAREGHPELKITDLVADPGAPAETPEQETSTPPPPRDEAKIFPLPTMADAPVHESMQEQFHAFFDSSAEASDAAPASQPWHAPDTPHGRMTPSPSMPGQDWPSAEELARHVPEGSGKVDEPPPAPGAAPEPAPQPAPFASSPMPLDSYVSLSSFEQGRREVALEVNVELHIFGRAKPGTELTLYGQPVPLRPDGTFSVHKPLPQGAVVLPLLAVDPPADTGA